LEGKGGHAPVELRVRSGQRVSLSAEGTSDPDGDPLVFRWFQYREAGSYDGAVPLENASTSQVRLRAPEVTGPETIQLVLEVKDGGEPALYRYRRATVHVRP
jgi:hypothetical protein